MAQHICQEAEHQTVYFVLLNILTCWGSAVNTWAAAAYKWTTVVYKWTAYPVSQSWICRGTYPQHKLKTGHVVWPIPRTNSLAEKEHSFLILHFWTRRAPDISL